MFNQRAYRVGRCGWTYFFPAGVFVDDRGGWHPAATVEGAARARFARLPHDEAEAIWNTRPEGFGGNDETYAVPSAAGFAEAAPIVLRDDLGNALGVFYEGPPPKIDGGMYWGPSGETHFSNGDIVHNLDLFDQGGLKRTPEGLLESVHIPTAEEAREEKMPYMATGTGGPPPKKPPVLEWRVESDGWVTLLVDGEPYFLTHAQHHVVFRNWRTVGVKRAKKHLLDRWEREQADIAWAERESGRVER